MAIAGLSVTDLVELALMLVAVGALSGFFAGIFGIGGGAILVPVFYECFRLAGVPLEVRMPLCIGTSLAIIIPTSISSFRAHYARGAVDMEILKRWWIPVVIGVVAGSVTARYAPERLFKVVFVCVAWSAATRLLLARVRSIGSSHSGTSDFWRQRLTAVAMTVLIVPVIVVVLMLIGSNQAGAKQIFSSLPIAIIMLLFIVASAWHMKIGMQVVIEDYVHNEKIKLASVMANNFFCIAVALASIYAILKMSSGV